MHLLETFKQSCFILKSECLAAGKMFVVSLFLRYIFELFRSWVQCAFWSFRTHGYGFLSNINCQILSLENCFLHLLSLDLLNDVMTLYRFSVYFFHMDVECSCNTGWFSFLKFALCFRRTDFGIRFTDLDLSSDLWKFRPDSRFCICFRKV